MNYDGHSVEGASNLVPLFLMWPWKIGFDKKRRTKGFLSVIWELWRDRKEKKSKNLDGEYVAAVVDIFSRPNVAEKQRNVEKA